MRQQKPTAARLEPNPEALGLLERFGAQTRATARRYSATKLASRSVAAKPCLRDQRRVASWPEQWSAASGGGRLLSAVGGTPPKASAAGRTEPS